MEMVNLRAEQPAEMVDNPVAAGDSASAVAAEVSAVEQPPLDQDALRAREEVSK